MAGTKCIITGVPGVAKTPVITEALKRLDAAGTPYAYLSFGSFMFEVAEKSGLVKKRDEMRLLGKDDQRQLQQKAAEEIARIDGNVIIDTHASVKTPKGYLAGLPEWVLDALKPDRTAVAQRNALALAALALVALMPRGAGTAAGEATFADVHARDTV